MHSSYFYLNEAARFNLVIYNITVYFDIIGYGGYGFITYIKFVFTHLQS
ncbi:hypothetical protein M128_1809 [Bacteroides fragilis str. S6L8]|uniref:Uncharacterized protein n=2 Tax=Bacteroidaceae TaxID=815 RepID=S0FEM7_9BACT|nr:hypothetical protein BACCOPRO_03444 [Phocaeicola coprophilus DSM 18228 = JCM 13818]EXY44153.1 hypothetical protein M118_4340 [Bacteroides fragilis str. 3783N1-2]EXY48742.1 hypothetical protein M121_4499 [Bacteroides fragilis str. 3783N2-1]EXY53203.1 hypothetical protein M122_4824 [Bacteroides fragilis str. 3976T7]EXY85615.1 hypothetical protein M079_1153 [Bacteroides fragilis str. 3996 N(B) 6]EYB00369.1 hypothetical protein M128_1809 [Bacteroides fragilis str. S6L8]EYB10496.1 hypothetical 